MRQTIILGGGCFWCTEAIFVRVKGVEEVVPGYAGGDFPNPDYATVTSGITGHAEVIRVEFDDQVISLEKILEIFFEIHDPTTPNRQGNDVGTQYRSIILYTQDKQLEIIDKVVAGQNKKIVSEIKPLKDFYPAEDYHSDYYAKNKIQPYCSLVILPKIRHFEEKYKDWIK